MDGVELSELGRGHWYIWGDLQDKTHVATECFVGRRGYWSQVIRGERSPRRRTAARLGVATSEAVLESILRSKGGFVTEIGVAL